MNNRFRGKITRILGLGGKQHTILDELGISTGSRIIYQLVSSDVDPY